jgi:hypothetical protein
MKKVRRWAGVCAMTLLIGFAPLAMPAGASDAVRGYGVVDTVDVARGALILDSGLRLLVVDATRVVNAAGRPVTLEEAGDHLASDRVVAYEGRSTSEGVAAEWIELGARIPQ